jgi:hypothetical protein
MRDYYYAWDFARLQGSPKFRITVSLPSSTNVDFTTGAFAHVSLSSVAGAPGDFATALDAAMPAAYAVTWDATTGLYTITYSGAFSLTFPNTTAGNNAADILGFDRNTVYSGAATYTSVRRPYYFIRSHIAGQSRQSDEYEPDGIAVDGEADDGTAYGIARLDAPTYLDWTQPFEQPTPAAAISDPGNAVFRRDATALIPWTWQDAFEHARNFTPIHLRSASSSAGPVVKMRAEGARFAPQRVTDDYQGLWNIPFQTRLMGRVGSAPPPVSRSIQTVSGFTSANYYSLTSSSLFPGSANMTFAMVLRTTAPNTSGADLRVFQKTSVGNRGYRCYIQPPGSQDRPSILVVNAVPTTITCVNTLSAAWDTTKFHTIVWRSSVALNEISVWLNGVKMSVTTALSGYTAATSSDILELMRLSSGATPSPIELVALSYSEQAATDANIAAFHAQVSVANNFDIPGVTTIEKFDANTLIVGAAPASWPGSNGYASLARQGTATVNTYASPVFA